jgi:tetratricopeptide (TPR) repeat protein
MAQIGDSKGAQNLTEELSRKYPSDTLIQKYWLPTIFARAELRQGRWSKAIDDLSVAVPFDFATPPTLSVSTMYPAYVRGETYLAAGDGNRAAAEYGKLIDRPGMVLNFPLGALAHLGRARAYALLGDATKTLNSYREFLDPWKEADASLPVLLQARAEYSKLK